MSRRDRDARHGLSLPVLLGVAFIILKLLGEITWPWIWVLAPFWGLFALVLALAIVAGAIAGVARFVLKALR